MITIDGIDYNVPISELALTADFLDRYAQRTESGDLERSLIGVYFNQSMTFGFGNEKGELGRLFDKLTEPVEFHDISVYTPMGKLDFKAYFSNIQTSMVKLRPNDSHWTGLTVNFIAKAPSRS